MAGIEVVELWMKPDMRLAVVTDRLDEGWTMEGIVQGVGVVYVILRPPRSWRSRLRQLFGRPPVAKNMKSYAVRIGT